MSRPSQPSGRSSYGATRALGVGLERSGCDDVGGQLRVVRQRVVVAKLLGHLASDEDGVRASTEVHEHAELVLDLRATRDEDERPLDVAEQPTEHLQLLLEEQPRVRGQQPRDALGRRVRPMRGAEGVVDEQVPAFGEPTGRLGIVRRLARIEPRVLEHLDALVRKELAEPRGDRRDRERRIRPFRAAEMRADRDVRRAAIEQILQRRQRRADARVVGDLARPRAGRSDRRARGRACPRRPRHEPSGAGASATEEACRSGRRADTSSPTRCRTSRTP